MTVKSFDEPNALATELNATLAKENPNVLAMLSDFGKRIFFPKGILAQAGPEYELVVVPSADAIHGPVEALAAAVDVDLVGYPVHDDGLLIGLGVVVYGLVLVGAGLRPGHLAKGAS